MPDLHFGVAKGEKAAFVIDERDNVAVALCDLKKGDACTVRCGERRWTIAVCEDVPFGHKLALHPLRKGESVFKYGEEIGKMKEPVAQGGWIHNHNLYCERGLAGGRSDGR